MLTYVLPLAYLFEPSYQRILNLLISKLTNKKTKAKTKDGPILG